MRCEEATKLLSLRLDEPLATENVSTLTAHVSVCHSCRRYASLLDALPGLLNSAQAVAPPSEFTASVMRRLAATTPSPIPHRAHEQTNLVRSLSATVVIAIGLVTVAGNLLVSAFWPNYSWLTWLSLLGRITGGAGDLVSTLYDLGEVGLILFAGILSSEGARLVANAATITALALVLWAVAMRPPRQRNA